MRRPVAAGLDVASVLGFVVVGRGSHDEGGGVGTVLTIAAPFLVGLAVAWLLSPNARWRPWSSRAGVEIWLGTVVVGMVLRRLVWDRGTAVSFVLVTAVVLGVLMVGWRVIGAITRRRREIRSVRPPSKAGR